MTSQITKRFREHFERLPEEVKRHARRAYRIWQANPQHPGLHFKSVSRRQPVYAVRIGIGWRALGLRRGDPRHSLTDRRPH
ncbi:MAG: hypothetical protein C1943_14200 [Halochromatium sp.]|nr:hypothetical protein [Halochromatium sp.]